MKSSALAFAVLLLTITLASGSPLQWLTATRLVLRRALHLASVYQPEWRLLRCLALASAPKVASKESEAENNREVRELFRTLVKLKSRLQRFRRRRPQAAAAAAALEEALQLYAAASVTLLAEEAAAEAHAAAEAARNGRQIALTHQGWLDWVQNLAVSPVGVCSRDYVWSKMEAWIDFE